jgi:hypothetical protein
VIEPVSPLLSLHSQFEAVKQQRQFQQKLAKNRQCQRQVEDAIFDAVDPDIRLALLPTVFWWEFHESLGGLLVVACYRDLPMFDFGPQLREFLEAVRQQTGINRVAFVTGDRQVRCAWDECWHVSFRRRLS